jgi:transposase-like protein
MGERKKFASEFKREAVRLMDSSEKPSSEIARQLGVRRGRSSLANVERRRLVDLAGAVRRAMR